MENVDIAIGIFLFVDREIPKSETFTFPFLPLKMFVFDTVRTLFCLLGIVHLSQRRFQGYNDTMRRATAKPPDGKEASRVMAHILAYGEKRNGAMRRLFFIRCGSLR